jgi:hypothetical protein
MQENEAISGLFLFPAGREVPSDHICNASAIAQGCHRPPGFGFPELGGPIICHCANRRTPRDDFERSAAIAAGNVRYCENGGKHLFGVRFSQFDPEPT